MNKLYISTFATIALLTILACTYMHGRITQSQVDARVTQERVRELAAQEVMRQYTLILGSAQEEARSRKIIAGIEP